MNQRVEFAMRSITKEVIFKDLCREYGISTKTGYKWRKRFLESGASGMSDESRRPRHHPEALREATVCEIVRLKNLHRKWGPRKIRAVYLRKHGEAPSESSFKRVLDKAGLVQRRRSRCKHRQRLVHSEQSTEPNHIWTVDFKGWWTAANKQRCEPLTIRDDFSRFLLSLRALNNGCTATVKVEFERAFERYGMPKIIRSDNGPPFAASQAPLGLSRLSAWWIALGITLDRIAPGHPEQNGGHERMHRDIRAELQGCIEGDLDDHQVAFDLWRNEFNHERPHEALSMQVPADIYSKSTTSYSCEQHVAYPSGMLERRVSPKGIVSLYSRKIFLTESLSGQTIGMRPITGSSLWEVWFNHLRLGQLDYPSETMTWSTD